MSPEISIIVPVYNTEKYIEKCSRSLFSQTFDSIEYCFIDDCSDDNSISLVKKVLAKFPNRRAACKFIRNETNIGVASSRNVELAIAEGKYIYFCDSDDYIDETMMEKIGNHVWLGKDAIIMKGVSIGDTAIVGMDSMVTKDVPEKSIVVGKPAKVIKTNVYWHE